MLEEDRHPAALETYTVYVVAVSGLTVIFRAVSPVDHRYAAYPGPASSVTAPQFGLPNAAMVGATGGAQTADIGIDQSSLPLAASAADRKTWVPEIPRKPT